LDSWSDIKRWRWQTRKLLIRQRVELAAGTRLAQGEQVKRNLTGAIDLTPYRTLGIYWPIRGEIDVRDIAQQHIAGGGLAALPVVATAAAPLEFWRWHPGMGIRHDSAKIPIPAVREVVIPDALLIPLVGFDQGRFRLGYGGGYYDRTLAALSPRPMCVGLGYEAARLATIHPQPHDIPMDMIVTEQGLLRLTD